MKLTSELSWAMVEQVEENNGGDELEEDEEAYIKLETGLTWFDDSVIVGTGIHTVDFNE